MLPQFLLCMLLKSGFSVILALSGICRAKQCPQILVASSGRSGKGLGVKGKTEERTQKGTAGEEGGREGEGEGEGTS